MKLKKLDFVVIFTVLLLSIIFFAGFGAGIFNSEGKILQIFSDGRLYAEYNLEILEKDIELDVKNQFGSAEVKISRNGVLVADADCPDGLCVGKHIDKNGHSIVCVPNKILICIVSDKSAQVDSMAY